MSALNFKIDAKRCTKCGACAADCPSAIIKLSNNGLPAIAPEAESDCIACQHCLAVCPTAAISIFGKDPAHSLELAPGKLPTLEQADTLLRGRRSVRHYLDENIDPKLLQKLLDSVANCPTGCNNRALTFTVIDDKGAMARFREAVMQSLSEARKANLLPDQLSFMAGALDDYYAQRDDMVFRGAPHVLIVSAKPDAPCGDADVLIALSYFELLANCAGVGTVWCWLLKWVLEFRPELKKLIGLPEGHAYGPMLFGLPKVKYARTVQRDDSATIKRISL